MNNMGKALMTVVLAALLISAISFLSITSDALALRADARNDYVAPKSTITSIEVPLQQVPLTQMLSGVLADSDAIWAMPSSDFGVFVNETVVLSMTPTSQDVRILGVVGFVSIGIICLVIAFVLRHKSNTLTKVSQV